MPRKTKPAKPARANKRKPRRAPSPSVPSVSSVVNPAPMPAAQCPVPNLTISDLLMKIDACHADIDELRKRVDKLEGRGS